MVKFTKALSVGPVTLVDEGDALTNITFTGGEEFACEIMESPTIRKGFQQLEEYLDHRRMIFTVDFRLPKGEDFVCDVFRIIQTFPYGETYPVECITQGLGLPLNELTRAEIADIVECNPLPILIPCHRLVDDGVRHPYEDRIRDLMLELEKTPPGI